MNSDRIYKWNVDNTFCVEMDCRQSMSLTQVCRVSITELRTVVSDIHGTISGHEENLSTRFEGEAFERWQIKAILITGVILWPVTHTGRSAYDTQIFLQVKNYLPIIYVTWEALYRHLILPPCWKEWFMNRFIIWKVITAGFCGYLPLYH